MIPAEAIINAQEYYGFDSITISRQLRANYFLIKFHRYEKVWRYRLSLNQIKKIDDWHDWLNSLASMAANKLLEGNIGLNNADRH